MSVRHYEVSSALQTQHDTGWLDLISRLFVPLECHIKQPHFYGQITHLDANGYRLFKVQSGAQSVFRTKKLASLDRDGYYLLSFALSGRGDVIQDGRKASLSPGECSLYDSRRAYELKFDQEFQQIVFMIPHILLNKHYGSAECMTARSIGADNPVNRILYCFLENMLLSSEKMTAALLHRLSHQATGLVGSMLMAAHIGDHTVTSHQLNMVAHIRTFIEEQLHNETLNRGTISAHFGVSPRYLDRLWQHEEEGISTYILKRRLGWAAEALSDPARNRYQIGEIAHMGGFTSQSHFSRVFSSTYGISPRQYRHKTQQNTA